MNIVYLVFGQDITHYQQVFFSIYTALRYKDTSDRIIIITESSSLFNHFGDSVTLMPINREIIKEWEGEYHFFWRVKIKALELISNKYPQEHILYLDGDTFFYKPISQLKRELDKGQNFMHLNEGKLSILPTKTEKLMWKQTNGKTFGNLKIDNNTCMWNAGLIGISNIHHKSIDLTLRINDELCAANVTRRLIEQFAFSIGTNYYSPLQSAEHIVGHYWGNKEQWNVIISNWLKQSLMSNLKSHEMINELNKIPFNEIPIYIHQSNTRKRLINKINLWFKPKNKVYIEQ